MLYDNCGNTYLSLNNFETALAYFNKAQKLNPLDAYPYYNRACTYARMGDPEKALRDLQKAIALNPDFKDYARRDTDLTTLKPGGVQKACLLGQPASMKLKNLLKEKSAAL